jgi:nucleolar GTP-binding protein
MAFDTVPIIEPAQSYLDSAFKAGNKYSNTQFDISKFHRPSDMSRIESERVVAMAQYIKDRFDKISSNFPSFDNLSEFYIELSKLHFDVSETKKHLAALHWCSMQSNKLAKEAAKRIKRSRNPEFTKKLKTEFFGRLSSLIKQIRTDLIELEVARKAMREFPALKTDCTTICIAGFPSVGKSTLLSKITTAKPKIAAYDFTTKQLNIGYAIMRHQTIQFVDAPGTLHRETMNDVERQAHLAMKYLADLIIFVYDPVSKFCDETQMKLLKDIKDYDKEFIMYISKTDLIDEKYLAELKGRFPDAVIDSDGLKSKVNEFLKRK